jgi:hypothetical protein
MIKKVLCLLALASITVGQNYYESMMTVRNTFYGGIALAVGEGASGLNPGVTLCMEPLKKINEYFSAGGHIEYAWLSTARLPQNVSEGGHFFDVAFVPKVFIPVASEMNFVFEIDPGLFGLYYYRRLGGYSNSVFKAYLGLTLGAGFNVHQFSLMFKYKSMFTENVSLAVHWITFSVGIAL